MPTSSDGLSFDATAQDEDEEEEERMVIVPGFDGSLYWITASADGDSGDSAHSAYLLPLNALEVADTPPHALRHK